MPVSSSILRCFSADSLRRAARNGAALALGLGLGLGAQAEVYGLIWTLGQYRDEGQRIVGMDDDLRMAREMADLLGVPGKNLYEVKDQDLYRNNMGRSMADFTARIGPGDEVFIYYSGHGWQQMLQGRCIDALVSYEGLPYWDNQLFDDLSRLLRVARKVVFFNDSCFAAGAIHKSEPRPRLGSRGAWAESDDDLPPKYYTAPMQDDESNQPGDPRDWVPKQAKSTSCGVPSNDSVLPKMLREGGGGGSIGGKGQSRGGFDAPGGQLIYLAAARRDHVAYPSRQGSLATRGWMACLTQSRLGANMTGQELTNCAQGWLNANSRKVQTLWGEGPGYTQQPLLLRRSNGRR